MIAGVKVFRIMCIALTVIITLGSSGCGNRNAGALAHMEQKYGEKFEYVSAWGSSYTTPKSRQILVSCGSLPDKKILVVISKDGKSETYRDNYMDFYFENQTKEYINNVANNYFNDFTFDISIPRTPSAMSVDSEIKFDDYIRNKDRFILGYMEIIDSNMNTLQNFLNELKELEVYFSFYIDIVSIGEGYVAQYFYGDDEISFNNRALP